MRESPARLRVEIAIVLGLSLGSSAVYSVVSLLERSTRGVALADQTASLNANRDPREWLDATYQLLDIVFSLVPVALVVFLLWRPGRSGFRAIGLDLRRPGSDLARAALLLVVIGVPGIALYAAGRALGVTVAVSTFPADPSWWTIPVLVLAALRAGLEEEVIVVGYLFTRLRQLGLGTWTIILSAAVLRGSYHLYQGYGPFVGNVAMGIVFGWCYTRWGRTMPLVIAHWAIDIVSFVGYPLALAWWPGLFGPSA